MRLEDVRVVVAAETAHCHLARGHAFLNCIVLTTFARFYTIEND
jgi:hypothetical protein